MRLLTGQTQISPRTVIRKKLADAKEEEQSDAKKRVLAVVLVVLVCSLVLGSILANWTNGQGHKQPQQKTQGAPHEDAHDAPHPKILTVFASRNPEALNRFKSSKHDMVRSQHRLCHSKCKC